MKRPLTGDEILTLRGIRDQLLEKVETMWEMEKSARSKDVDHLAAAREHLVMAADEIFRIAWSQ